MKTYYFDNAASSWPKPDQVPQAMVQCLQDYGANPGRGSHRMAVKASRVVFETRTNLAKLFRVANANDICFTSNTTEALNLAIKGFLKNNDHVISTSIEHNSVRRPLEYLCQTKGVKITYVNSDREGYVSLENIRQAIRDDTKLLICNHSSNLLGTIAPITEIAQLCKENNVKLLVDAAQTAGTVPIDVINMGIHMLAFPGHKGLMGPQGTGGLYVHPEIELFPLIHGGTGSQSENSDQPMIRPDRYEAGTLNTVGIAGLNEGVKFVLQQTVETIRLHEKMLTKMLMEGLLSIEGIRLLGPNLGDERTGIVAFLLPNIEASQLAFILDKTYGIAVRAGFHCTPLAHQSAGTITTGAVRASVGYFTTTDDIQYLIDAVTEISKQ